MRFIPLLLILLACTPRPDVDWPDGPRPPTPPLTPVTAAPEAVAQPGADVQARGDALRAWAASTD